VLFLKLGLLSSLLYAVIVLVSFACIAALMIHRGLMIGFSGRHLGWVMAGYYGALLFLFWLISFVAAWLIVYPSFWARLPR
jgi:hypothetical protein